MNTLLFAFAEEAAGAAKAAVAASTATASALPDALQISGVALVAIFCVMGLFGAMIALLTRLFPDGVEETP